MLEWDGALKICNADLYLDSRQARTSCVVSHAHSDHLPDSPHVRTFATRATATLSRYRSGVGEVVELAYGTQHDFCPDTVLRLLPAGHVVGSAMAHITRPEGTLLYTGDFKLRDSLTAAAAEPCPADVLVMESTYGRPLFRFPPWRQVMTELVERVGAALRAGRQPVVMGYSLGKAQEAVRALTDAGIPVTCHGAVFAMNQISERLGVRLGPYRRYRFEDFHGPAALDLAERGALVAPPHAARSAFVTRFKDPLRIVLTGWAMLKGAQYRYGVDHALPLSDHADFGELLELIDRVRPRKIFTYHGFRDFVETLRARGLDASYAEPEAQLSLFGD